MRQVKLPCGAITEIDEQDAYLLEVFPHWRKTKGYVIITRYIPVRQDVYLARAIVKPKTIHVIDHADRNPLNNKRSNLRIATNSQNCVNKPKQGKTSKYHGVSRAKKAKTNPWRVYARYKDGRRTAFSYATELDAAKGWDKYAKEYWGEFAPLNFPDEK